MKLFWMIFLIAFSLHAEEGVKKVVYDLTTGDIKTLEQRILKGIPFTKDYYDGRFEELETAVIIHGDAYKFFVKEPQKSSFKNDKALMKKHDELAKRLESLASNYKTEFIMCKVGMEKNRLAPKDIYGFVTFAANSTVALIDKQNDHYAYIPAD